MHDVLAPALSRLLLFVSCLFWCVTASRQMASNMFHRLQPWLVHIISHSHASHRFFVGLLAFAAALHQIWLLPYLDTHFAHAVHPALLQPIGVYIHAFIDHAAF
jgi:hypothetical protein